MRAKAKTEATVARRMRMIEDFIRFLKLWLNYGAGRHEGKKKMKIFLACNAAADELGEKANRCSQPLINTRFSGLLMRGTSQSIYEAIYGRAGVVLQNHPPEDLCPAPAGFMKLFDACVLGHGRINCFPVR